MELKFTVTSAAAHCEKLISCCATSIPGVIYLKNMVSQFWQEREAENVTDPVPFSLHEQDKLQIRENIVEGVIQAPDPVR